MLDPDGMRRRSRAARQLWDRIRCTARVDQAGGPGQRNDLFGAGEYTGRRDQDTDEAQGQPTYEYSGLESGNQVAAEYVQMLEDNYDCSILGSRDAPKEEPDFQAERGEVTVGTKCAEGDGIFALEIRWQTQSCSITPVLLEGAEEEAESLTVEEAVHFLEEMPPERLGLSGSDMSSYLLFPEEGIVMVDGMPCYCINAYGREDHQILDTYLVSEDGSGLYRLDRGEDAVSALT